MNNLALPGAVTHLLFAQHGWADTAEPMRELAAGLATSGTRIIAPDLGYLRTWLRIAPLIDMVEREALAALAAHPEAPISVIGHSMGGLIWLELLKRHPEWLPRIVRFALLGAPVAGADLARILDPLGLGAGIAADLGRNRRHLAERIAQRVPTLVLAGDSDGGSDGTLPVMATEVLGATMIVLAGIDHAGLRTSPRVRAYLHRFWRAGPCPRLTDAVTGPLQHVPGMTTAHLRDFPRARVVLELADGTTLRLWKNPVGVDHVFVADARGQCVFGGFVGWIHAKGLMETIHSIEHDVAEYRIVG
ncbi:MAG: alpha/beta hydrolase [Oscillochloris sp.]|nr:alpha/beta hydrolase [Oscillochloris sp.]